jgi:hypoxanthine-DNA glycosylase
MHEQLEKWAAALRESVAEATVENGALVVIVWDEAAARRAWKLAARFGVPEHMLRVIRPVPFLMPYPRDDVRNQVAEEEFWRKNLRMGDNGQQYLLTGLEPAVSPGARVLILGSMPGPLSLRLGEYYAHPRNRFWLVVGELLDVTAALPYPERVARLEAKGIALWDVLRHCARVGALDKNIDSSTEVPNEIEAFLDAHPAIDRIVLNGKKAERAFEKHVGGSLGNDRGITVRTAPSTSPANAAVKHLELIERWRLALQ